MTPFTDRDRRRPLADEVPAVGRYNRPPVDRAERHLDLLEEVHQVDAVHRPQVVSRDAEVAEELLVPDVLTGRQVTASLPAVAGTTRIEGLPMPPSSRLRGTAVTGVTGQWRDSRRDGGVDEQATVVRAIQTTYPSVEGGTLLSIADQPCDSAQRDGRRM